MPGITIAPVLWALWPAPGQVGAVGLVGPDGRCTQEFHLDGVVDARPMVGLPTFLTLLSPIVQPLRDVEIFCFRIPVIPEI